VGVHFLLCSLLEIAGLVKCSSLPGDVADGTRFSGYLIAVETGNSINISSSHSSPNYIRC